MGLNLLKVRLKKEQLPLFAKAYHQILTIILLMCRLKMQQRLQVLSAIIFIESLH